MRLTDEDIAGLSDIWRETYKRNPWTHGVVYVSLTFCDVYINRSRVWMEGSSDVLATIDSDGTVTPA
jgi:hypothetical protein